MSDLITRWGRNLNPKNILTEYPRPQLVRKSYMNLNGEWDYAITKEPYIESYQGKILVPFAPETALSGVNKIVQPDDYLHYQLIFKVPFEFIQSRLLLHFGAVDQECEVFLNDKKVGEHKGGYLPFSFDVTSFIEHEQPNYLQLRVIDRTEHSPHARGKQKLSKNSKMDAIFYTPSSGIWKTVWLESVPKNYITQVRLTPNLDAEAVALKIQTSSQTPAPAYSAKVEISFKGTLLQKSEIKTNQTVELPLKASHPWSPEEPNLYDVKITYEQDEIKSYFALRKFTKEKDRNGTWRFFLNNEPYFINGLLDQGYWPESLLTAPTDEALKFDILKTKELGFNTIRKHVKIEPERFYYHCDKIGLLVLQDMPNGGADINKPFAMYLPNISDKLSRKIKDNRYTLFGRADEEGRAQYTKDLEKMVTTLYNYPSIAMWIPFNEGWGQFDAKQATARLREIDPTRFIMETSGWFDQGGGDVYSIHNYFKKLKVRPQIERIVAVTEFGGFAFPVKNHLYSEEKFGYRSYKTPEEFTQKYRKLYEEQILSQIASGLSGAIYTQTTDVEGEINGLLTYDREITKIDRQITNSINQALYNVFNSITH